MGLAEKLVEDFKGRFGENVVSAELRKPRRIYAEVKVCAAVDAARFLFDERGARFAIATGMEMPDAFEVLYHFAFDKHNLLFNLRVRTTDKVNPRLPSFTPIAVCFDWIEREIHDLLGIEFDGREKTPALLRAEDWPEGFYPLRPSVPTSGDREGTDL